MGKMRPMPTASRQMAVKMTTRGRFMLWSRKKLPADPRLREARCGKRPDDQEL
jgi:hypothetical protein